MPSWIKCWNIPGELEYLCYCTALPRSFFPYYTGEKAVGI